VSNDAFAAARARDAASIDSWFTSPQPSAGEHAFRDRRLLLRAYDELRQRNGHDEETCGACSNLEYMRTLIDQKQAAEARAIQAEQELARARGEIAVLENHLRPVPAGSYPELYPQVTRGHGGV
jgi:nitrate/TMAO reductase-like tetraheme cytochrome c subunit